MSLSKVLEIARGELGTVESPPNSNRVKYWDEWWPSMQGKPWCVGIWGWVFDKAGERLAFFGGGKTASCGTLLRWYREQGLTVPVEQVQKGDIAILNFRGTSDTEHCGLVEEVYSNPIWGLNIDTIEGNTTPGSEGSQDNGGCVARKNRFKSQIVAVCRPQYKPEEEEPMDDITGHWAEEAIRRCMVRKIINGYPDGSFRPNEPITRAEAATMIDRLVQLLIGEDDGK